MERIPTMNDVAREADVALKTVSRYVNGATNIAPELAGRIGTAIERLGYRRNLAAASIRPGQSSRVLGLIIADIANPFYSLLARAVEDTAAEAGYLLMTASSGELHERYDRIVGRMLEQRVDGVIAVPPPEAVREWSAYRRPRPALVYVDRAGEHRDADSIVSDNAGGAQSAVAALLAGGATRPAFLGDAPGIATMRERRAGYLAALREAGIRPDPAWERHDVHTAEDGTRAVHELIAAGAADSVFAANNRAALGAAIGFDQLDARLPIVGFDDFESAVLARPAISVVQQDVDEMGRRAANLLLQRMAGDDAPARRIVLPTRLVIRGSES